MGAKQSKRSGSVDITGTPKKGEVENGAAVEGGRLERIEDDDILPGKVAANGTTPHVETQETSLLNGEHSPETPEKKEGEQEEAKTPDTPATTEAAEPETPVSPSTDEGAVSTPGTDQESNKRDTATPTDKDDKSDKKRKEKTKKKWSFRSISFSKKDKSKPTVAREDSSKNGDLVKEDILAEVSETAENVAAAAEKAINEVVSGKVIQEVIEELPKQIIGENKEAEKETAKEEAAPSEAKPSEESKETSDAVVPQSVPKEKEESKEIELTQPAKDPIVEEVKEHPKEPELISSVTHKSDEPVAVEKLSPVKVEPPVEEKPTPVSEPEPEINAALPQVILQEVIPPSEEIPPPLPASPPPTEAPPPTPVQATPTPAPEVEEHKTVEDKQSVEEPTKEETPECDEVAGGGGESMAELNVEDNAVTSPVDTIINETSELKFSAVPEPPPVPMVNGIANDDSAHKIIDDIVDKVEVKSLPIDHSDVNEVSEAVVNTATHTDLHAE
ncbi:uncharacterized protein LOC142327038 isoform X2 [Lycorma delicatula]|uniref:uncharacterized protein LOC142327038 isoform X2 n=1 Tax=Lycorma delicatula TaxID=130591 RepID=UPI003F511F26